MSKREVIRFLILRTIGNFLLLFALSGIIFTFGQALVQEATYRYNNWRGIHYSLTTDTTKETSGFTYQQEKIISIVPLDTDFGIVIPKINANAKILPNIDPSNYQEYMGALRLGVAHSSGTPMPGTPGNVYLFAHSTDYFWNVGRYNAVFYLLKELDKGDEIDVFFAGRRYIYMVSDKKIINPDDVAYLTESYTGEERLTLQTCWPPGTTIKRLLIFAKPKGV